ncbi:PepSY domain-containing protein [Planococcus sp. NCCP-2050]|uniref:PepSY domain-containing protein n=1 Tax=Planococcus sp. NCCP-2050 TaxID=2944679 RepID=UPI00203C7A3F|nr:PepSY domain-containing protein [Planococcus sp. NCCP-2050]GKW45059.1 hypothetical protein NCCP2050_07510 [Planococcus sp. NCCP-2050]
MKKFIYIPVTVGVLAFGGVVLANTQNSETPAVNSTTNQAENGTGNSAQENFLSFDEVSSKALGIANGTITDIELDQNARTPHYEVDVWYDGYDYDLKFDAVTGEVMEQKKEREDRDDDDFEDNGVAAPADENLISSDEAIKAAQAVAKGTVEKVELDHEDGVAYYEVEIEDGRTDHEIYVNATDGSILEHETDNDDDDDDRD